MSIHNICFYGKIRKKCVSVSVYLTYLKLLILCLNILHILRSSHCQFNLRGTGVTISLMS